MRFIDLHTRYEIADDEDWISVSAYLRGYKPATSGHPHFVSVSMGTIIDIPWNWCFVPLPSTP